MDATDEDRLDRWLENALRHWGSAEPGFGLEERVTAKLTNQGNTARPKLQILLPFFALAAAALCVTVWVGVGKQNAVTPPTGVRTLNPANAGERQVPPQAVAVKRPRGKRRAQKRAAPAIWTGNVHQFPSPTPLTEQELLFARYAEQFPKDAMLIAQEQRTFEEGTRRAENELRNSTAEPDREK